MSGLVSAPELLTLQAVRLAGMADAERVTERIPMPPAAVRDALADAAERGFIEELGFVDLRGWILTERGRTQLTGLLSAEAEAPGLRPLLTGVTEDFETVNARFVELVSHWQLRSTGAAAVFPSAAETEEFEELLRALEGFGSDLAQVLDPLLRTLPRFGRYPEQYMRAVARARIEGLTWVTGVGLLSCHTVWAELHQDLLSTLGRERAPQRDPGPEQR